MRAVATALSALLLVATAKHLHRAPIIDLHGAEEFIGLIREDQQVLSVAPRLAILAETGPVCKYELVSTDGEELPFEAIVQNEHQGTALIKVKDAATLDCAHSQYNVRLVAVRCGEEGSRSEPVPLKITVKDTNNHAPEFDAPWYSFNAEEGHIYKVLARVFATDKDCGQPYGTICRYEITNALEKSPFRLSDDGVLSNIVPLNYSEAQSHILTVVAHDCGMRRSKSTLVTVNVLKKCTSQLETAEEGTLVKDTEMPLAPEASLKFCEDKEQVCVPKSFEAVLLLKSSAAAPDCALDSATVDLLAKPKAAPLSPEDDDDEDDDDDDDEEDEEDEASSEEKQNAVGMPASAEQDNYAFDGSSNSVIVSPSLVKAPVPEKFTLSFSMKHAKGPKEAQGSKQNILCESDEDQLNRHHFAIYIRHCKLELLLRREAEHATPEFRAAEWRWQAPEVCDNQWHSYSILFNNLDDVQLFVDGKKFVTNDRNPEILDDWPLHQTKQLKTRLVVGACWHARSQSMVQFFNGRLANMKLLVGKVEQMSAISCSHEPRQKLLLNVDDQLKPGDAIVFNNAHSEVVIKATEQKELERLIRAVKLSTQTEDDATVQLTATQHCQDGRAMATQETKISFARKKSAPPMLSISGINLINTDRRSLKVGTSMLPELDIIVTETDSITGKPIDVTSNHKLSWCKVYLKPARDMDLEYFSSPAALIAALNVDFEHDKQGIMLKGVESVKGYQEILSKIHYFNTRPDAYNKRLYSVQCALENEKVHSNEFTVTMTIDMGVDELDAPEKPKTVESIVESLEAESEDGPKFGKQFAPAFESNRLQNILEMDLPRPKALLSHRGYDVGQGAVAGGAIAIVVVICVGFLLVLLVVGVLKMRDTPIPHRRKSRRSPSEGAMEWDDGGMNITMNPLEDIEKNGGAAAFSDDDDEDVPSSDDAESYRDDEEVTEDDDDEDADILPHSTSRRSGLEWDDSTLTNVSRTYRI